MSWLQRVWGWLRFERSMGFERTASPDRPHVKRPLAEGDEAVVVDRFGQVTSVVVVWMGTTDTDAWLIKVVR